MIFGRLPPGTDPRKTIVVTGQLSQPLCYQLYCRVLHQREFPTEPVAELQPQLIALRKINQKKHPQKEDPKRGADVLAERRNEALRNTSKSDCMS